MCKIRRGFCPIHRLWSALIHIICGIHVSAGQSAGGSRNGWQIIGVYEGLHRLLEGTHSISVRIGIG